MDWEIGGVEAARRVCDCGGCEPRGHIFIVRGLEFSEAAAKDVGRGGGQDKAGEKALLCLRLSAALKARRAPAAIEIKEGEALKGRR